MTTFSKRNPSSGPDAEAGREREVGQREREVENVVGEGRGRHTLLYDARVATDEDDYV